MEGTRWAHLKCEWDGSAAARGAESPQAALLGRFWVRTPCLTYANTVAIKKQAAVTTAILTASFIVTSNGGAEVNLAAANELPGEFSDTST